MGLKNNPICPIPHLGHCVRERCNFWDEAQEQCTADCFDQFQPQAGGAAEDPEQACIICWTEDCD